MEMAREARWRWQRRRRRPRRAVGEGTVKEASHLGYQILNGQLAPCARKDPELVGDRRGAEAGARASGAHGRHEEG